MSIYINNSLVPIFLFSGGECSIKINPASINEQTKIVANLHNSDSIISLLLVVDAIRRINPETKINLIIPYFPYARQDRVCNPGESLSVKVMADLINLLHCQQVTIYDPHSDVTPALINNCTVITLADVIKNSLLNRFIHDNKLTLLSPDAGAEKKVSLVAKTLSTSLFSVPFICASKVRDTLTGKIITTKIHDCVQSLNILIVDDICDGGSTFIELAKLLRNQGANDLYLYVTHGIFSKGFAELQQFFKHVYCYQQLLITNRIDSSFLTVFNEHNPRGLNEN